MVEHTVETISYLDLDHPMSDAMEVTEIEQIEIIAHAYSQLVFELYISLDWILTDECIELFNVFSSYGDANFGSSHDLRRSQKYVH